MKKLTDPIREKSVEQLYKDLATLATAMREVRFKMAHREVADTTKRAKIRREIARIMTIIREKEEALLLKS
ncbi:MAG: 50S ribosomal protein L29 [Patescibacteria group bacterium]